MAGRWSLFTAGGLAAGYVALAIAACAWPRDAVDVAVSLAVQRADAMDVVWRAASALGGNAIAVILPVVAVVALLAVRARREAVWLTASTLGAFAIEYATKLLVARPRPGPPVEVREAVTGPGFPSGHVTSYVALFGFLAVIACARVRRRGLRIAAVAAVVAVVALVGPSRVYLGAHWPSDVVGGYLVSGAWLLVVARWYLHRR
jgi:undecaprenyl-diphosphatase